MLTLGISNKCLDWGEEVGNKSGGTLLVFIFIVKFLKIFAPQNWNGVLTSSIKALLSLLR